MNLLFVCSRNLWRSPTAEEIYKNRYGINVRSGGTEPSARIKVNTKSIQWADIIFVMEKKHKEKLLNKFSAELCTKPVIILDIPDDYKYMDPELIEDISIKVDNYLRKFE